MHHTAIITLGQINEALHFASVNAAQLAELGFQPLDNRAVCEGLPPEAAKPLRTARIYSAEALPLISAALLQRLAPHAAPATAAPCPPFERKCADDTEGGGTD